ncbi:hypothetical protein AALP_AA7G215800 [Arabis alpina]|uniref:Uncharacterized protein n=1 Tax=Arabis alpina TaxID=50452 RepID=A0A087GJN9_ARAAL|nr:hypothetical protein AALP_AA7G215800 [Arabis alpina]
MEEESDNLIFPEATLDGRYSKAKRACRYPALDEEAVKEYTRQVKESDGFDIAGVKVPDGLVFGLDQHHARSCSYGYNGVVKLYARMGLHRFNHTIEVKAIEGRHRPLCVRCTIARPEDKSKISTSPFLETGDQSLNHFYDGSSVDDFYKCRLLEWPGAFDDAKRFYEILKVVIETEEPVEPPEERLNAKCAVVYIWFINMFKPAIGKRRPIRCKTIVRRVFNETTGGLMLCSSGFIEEKGILESD